VSTLRPTAHELEGGGGGIVDTVVVVVLGWLAALQLALEKHKTAVLVAAFSASMAAGFVLRFFALGRLGLNSDEAVYTGQAATLAGVEGFAADFSIFRAHPLLYQYTVSLVYRAFGLSEVSPRVVSALFGVATVFVTYLIGKQLLGRRTGLVAAAILAVMPFHIVVARQALLETPMTLFYAAAIYALLRYYDVLDKDEPSSPALDSRIVRSPEGGSARVRRRSRLTPRTRQWAARIGWAFAIGALTGLAFMAKEVAAILLAIVFVSMLVTKHFRILDSIVVMGAFLATVSPHLLALRLGPASEGGGGWAEYVIWQMARPANHPIGFYLSNVFVYFGLPLLVLLCIGIWMAVRRARHNAALATLVIALVVPVWFFQVWKVKGWHYPVVIAPLAAVLAAYVLTMWWRSPHRYIRGVASAMAAVTIVTLVGISAINGPIVDNYRRVGEAGYSGIPGGRETALWLAENAPEGSKMLGIGPSIGNIIKWYSDHETSALSISPNPLRANPAYEPVRNPDYELRWGLVEYLVYDAYSAARTPHFANRLLDFVERYGGEIVHEETATLVGADGVTYSAPVIRVYRVGPVGIDLNPLPFDEVSS
jgi:4-amino-4-deoxy-L-arabinose transferase-like glycosyltransferase